MFHSLLRSTKLASSILYSPISTFPAKTSTTTKALGSLFSSSSFVTWSPVHVFSLMKKKGNLPAYRLITTSTSRLMNKETNEPSVEREIEKVDVLIVGAGPAGLSAAIRLKQLALEHQKEIRVMVIEKGAEIGSHILSGNVLEPRALNELIPDWKEKGAPLHTPATEDHIYFLTKKHAIPLPHPPHLKNKGNYVISLSLFVKWLGEQAENLGVEIYPGISGASLLLKKHAHDTPPLNTENQSGKSTPPSPSTSTALYGVRTGDLGLNADMTVSKNYSPGMEIHAPLTLLAEGCHGSLTKKTIQTFQLRAKDTFQTYGIGLKEVWEIPKAQHSPGLIMHTVGWPTDRKTYQGSFLYHWSDAEKDGKHLVSVGLVVGLDYQNPYIRPYMEFQRLKHHPAIAKHLNGGTCISYGARALNEGGYQSIPTLAFPGGALLGCAAGFVNVPKIKGTHTAMKSGMVAAEAAFAALSPHLGSSTTTTSSPSSISPIFLTDYMTSMKSSWVYDELYEVRNIRPSFRWGLYAGLMYSGLETLVLKGRGPWTLQHHSKPDHACLSPINGDLKEGGGRVSNTISPIEYPKPDGVLSFDLLDNLARAGTSHRADQPCHLKLKFPERHVLSNLKHFGGPEQRFCPAGVYEYIDVEPYTLDGDVFTKKFHINFTNCIHCKTCDIKDPSQSIDWTTPEGGNGPNYVLT